jgi:hypothetical protein
MLISRMGRTFAQFQHDIGTIDALCVRSPEPATCSYQHHPIRGKEIGVIQDCSLPRIVLTCGEHVRAREKNNARKPLQDPALHQINSGEVTHRMQAYTDYVDGLSGG